MLGNTFGDFVKGKKMEDVHPLVKQGVLLHRKIDHFTDQHEIVKKCVEVFRPVLGRFSAIVVDMVFDYFLAKKWLQFSQIELSKYVTELFVLYENNRINLTERCFLVAPSTMCAKLAVIYLVSVAL